MKRTKKKFIVALVDYFLLTISLCIVILIRFGMDDFILELEEHLPAFSVIYLLWIIVFYIFELYDITHEIYVKNYVYAMILNGAIAVTIFYTVKNLGITPKTNLLLNLIIFTLLFIPWRSFISHNFGRFFGRIKIAIIGVDEH